MNETTDATAILAPVWRRKWLVLGVAIVVALASYLYYKRQPMLFQGTTQVYLAAAAEEQFTEKGSARSVAVNAANQAAIINSIVVESVHHELRKEHNRIAKAAGHGKVRAKAAEKSQFITITTEVKSARGAALLANAVARAYIKRQHAQYERSTEAAIAIARRQLRRIETLQVVSAGSKGKGSSSTSNVIQAATLSSKINQLEAQLGVVGIEQIKPADVHTVVLLGPMPKKNATFGFAIGLVLAAIAAFGVSRINRRLRSLADIETVLQTQILTALPKTGRPIVDRDGRPRPSKMLVEPLRRLHTTLQLGNVVEHEQRGSPRSVLFLSADSGDGKSTLVAGLALVHGEAGERVAIIEADFRRPLQAGLLGLTSSRGLADVLTGRLTVAEGMQTVPSIVPEAITSSTPTGAGVTAVLAARDQGTVSVLVGTAGAPNPPVLLASTAMSDVLHSCAEDYDRVLIDAPSPLEVSDVMPLLAAVDAIVLVARTGHTRETSAQRLVELLAGTPSAPVIGVVANGVASKEIAKYGIFAGSGEWGWPAKLIRR